MAVVTEKPKFERRRSMVAIERLVNARTEVLSLYALLGDAKPFKDVAAAQELVQEFCQSLVDYAASAHFQLYRYFAEKNERRQEVADVAADIYPQVLEITNVILDFNDKYDCADQCSNLDKLDEDLSILGEQLADRIELEDRLITAFGFSFDK